MIKPEHQPYRTEDGKVRIGGGIHGIASEIDDPDGWLWILVEAMNGVSSIDEISARVRLSHPRVTTGAIRSAVGQLDHAGYVSDGADSPPAPLTLREQERYGRSRAYYRWTGLSPEVSTWNPQIRLKRTRVLLLGLGGAGSTAALCLAAAGFGHLHCVDRDVVELSNLGRQTLYRESDVGRTKVEAAVATLRRLNSDISVTGEIADIGSPGQLENLLRGFDLLVQCADQPPGLRSWCNRACFALGVPWVDSGYSGPMVTAGVYVPGAGACWECLRNSESESLHVPLMSGEDIEKTLPRAPGNPVSAASAALTGALAAHAAQSLITRAPEVPVGCLLGLNLMIPDNEIVLLRSARRDDCQACSAAPVIV